MSREHLAIAVGAATVSVLVIAVILSFIEIRLRALFARHEAREERMHATSQLAAEGAVAAAHAAKRTVEELRVEIAAQRLNLANMAELLRDQEGRLVAVEMKLVRASVAVPHHHRREGDGP